MEKDFGVAKITKSANKEAASMRRHLYNAYCCYSTLVDLQLRAAADKDVCFVFSIDIADVASLADKSVVLGNINKLSGIIVTFLSEGKVVLFSADM